MMSVGITYPVLAVCGSRHQVGPKQPDVPPPSIAIGAPLGPPTVPPAEAEVEAEQPVDCVALSTDRLFTHSSNALTSVW